MSDREPAVRRSLLRSVDLAALRVYSMFPHFDHEELIVAYDDFSEVDNAGGESLGEVLRSSLWGFWLVVTILMLAPCAVLSSAGLLPYGITVLPAVLGGVTMAAATIHGVVEGFYRRRGDGTRGFVAADNNTLFVLLALFFAAIFFAILVS